MSAALVLFVLGWVLMFAVVALYMVCDAMQARAVRVDRERDAAKRRHPAGGVGRL